MKHFNSSFAEAIYNNNVAHVKSNGDKETWDDTVRRVVGNVFICVGAKRSLISEVERMILEKKIMPAGRYLYASGRPIHMVSNCMALDVEDSREGWSELAYKASMSLMSGAGIGINYSKVRPEGDPIRKTGGTATGPISVMHIVNEMGRWVMQGGNRRSAILGSLSWKHKDIYKFIESKNWKEDMRIAKSEDMNAHAPLDGTNISVQLDDEFFSAYSNTIHPLHTKAVQVYNSSVDRMLRTGEPGFSVDVGVNSDEIYLNACSEFRSNIPSTPCNLMSINMARIETLDEMKLAVELAVAFLLAGSVYGDVPFPEASEAIKKNRRIGLGLMGVHEWLLVRGKKYGIDQELGSYLDVYATSGEVANKQADEWNISRPVKTRAIAPTGTISIVAETTAGIEPVFCSAYKRRYRRGKHLVEYQYVIDHTVARLVHSGIRPDSIEDAYDLAYNVEARMAFQAWVQKYVDMAIASTINLPRWGSDANNEFKECEFRDKLLKYLPNLRGITAYPDGGRGGQPITPVGYNVASKHIGQVFTETADVCEITRSGGCG